MRKYPAPSSFAASMSSVAIPSMYWRRKKIIVTLPSSPGTISGSRVSIQPICA